MQRCAGDIFQKNTIMSLKSSNPFTVFSTNEVLIILVYDIKDGIRRKVQILAIKIRDQKIRYNMKGRGKKKSWLLEENRKSLS